MSVSFSGVSHYVFHYLCYFCPSTSLPLCQIVMHLQSYFPAFSCPISRFEPFFLPRPSISDFDYRLWNTLLSGCCDWADSWYWFSACDLADDLDYLFGNRWLLETQPLLRTIIGFPALLWSAPVITVSVWLRLNKIKTLFITSGCLHLVSNPPGLMHYKVISSLLNNIIIIYNINWE